MKIVILFFFLILLGCYQESPCVSWTNKAVKLVQKNNNFIFTQTPSYLLDLFKDGKITGIPKGWESWSRGCCIDRLDYLVFAYKDSKKRPWNEVQVSAEWVQCKEYEKQDSYQWPPEIVIQKECYYCNGRIDWTVVESCRKIKL